MNTLVEKVGAYIEGQLIEPTHAFAIPGEDNFIDCINPATNRSAIYGETLDEVRVRYPRAEIISIQEFCEAKAAKQDSSIAWEKTTREKYEDMLNVLPPACYSKTYTAFLVGEPWDHHAISGRPRYQAFEMRDGKYWAANRPMTVQEFRTICRS